MNYKNLEKAASIYKIKKETKYLIKQLMASIDDYELGSLEIKNQLKQSIFDSFVEIEKDLEDEVKQF